MKGLPVTCDDLLFRYGPDAAPMRFDCTFAPRTITAVMGPSGSGKSTLLALIAGFERAASGRIMIGEDEVTQLAPARRPVSCVFQDNNLFAHLDVATNVALGMSPGMKRSVSDEKRLTEALAPVGLSGYGARMPGSLSGGERQRVAIARALVRERPVLLLDEAFGSLGPALRETMLDLVADLQRRTAMTVIMVSHDPADARRIATDLVFLKDGTVGAQGPVGELLNGRANADVNAYLGSQELPS
ncbi:MAG: ATP-binding cassette domain-containing protein [Roseitalea sp.]|jgi:thiamine transport system ATP-binding protein|nr:ATP-binding cassette domain-containing protein [Roseitalea sp.]MBO6721875.1 ATP-binding cassette domain-containing protein [Roseitalea sp.]MBO6744810.1 ATP-binding cassette domain-containing protein [Roseitalea sp.]